MELGHKVYFIDESESKAYIKKGTITAIINTRKYVDFLSSQPKKECTSIKYTVCAMKDGVMDYFESVDNVFETIASLKEYLAEKEFKKYDLVE